MWSTCVHHVFKTCSFYRSSIKPGLARPRKIQPPQPNYQPSPASRQQPAAKGQKPKTQPIRESDSAASQRRLWSDDHRRQCLQFACQGAILRENSCTVVWRFLLSCMKIQNVQNVYVAYSIFRIRLRFANEFCTSFTVVGLDGMFGACSGQRCMLTWLHNNPRWSPLISVK